MIAPNFKLLVKTFVKRDNEYLCIQRSTHEKSNQHEWDLPGGKLEFGENINIALEREILEEVGLKVINTKPIYTNSFMQKDRFVVGILYISEYRFGEVILSKEHEAYEWLKIEDLKTVKFQDWIVPAFEKLS